jgi:hypothetical protein
MKLFRKSSCPAKSGNTTPETRTPVPQPELPKKPGEISLSAEQKSLLEKPIDPRVSRILQKIYANKAEAERALNARRIIDFPHGDSGERHVIQDEHGFWRIVPGPPPERDAQLFDSL